MKRLFVLVLVMAFVMGFAGLAIADCDCYVYDNWQGELNHYSTGNEDTGGKVILNYVKGRGTYIANVTVYGLDPGLTYYVCLLTMELGQSSEQYSIGTFVANDEGEGHINVRGICPTEFELAGDNPRVVVFKGESSAGWDWITKTADGELQFLGSNRVKCEDCED